MSDSKSARESINLEIKIGWDGIGFQIERSVPMPINRMKQITFEYVDFYKHNGLYCNEIFK